MKITSAPDEKTTHPEFGIPPGRPVPIAYVARVIFKQYPLILYWVWDRQQIIGGTDAERKAFAAWMTTAKFETLIRKMVVDFDLRPSDAVQVARIVDDIEIQISPKRSHGYLYIGAWPLYDTLP